MIEEKNWHHDQNTLDALRSGYNGTLPTGHTIKWARHPVSGKIDAWHDAWRRHYSDKDAREDIVHIVHGPGGLFTVHKMAGVNAYMVRSKGNHRWGPFLGGVELPYARAMNQADALRNAQAEAFPTHESFDAYS